MEEKKAVWLCVLNSDSWKVVKGNMLWGVAQAWAKQIRKLRPGDLLVFYVKKPISSIVGIGEVSSEMFVDDNKLPWLDRSYPYRVRLRHIRNGKLELDEYLPLSGFVGKIEGVKTRWSLQRAMISLSWSDYLMICTLLKSPTANNSSAAT